MKIAFDLDGIFIDSPPLIPKSLIERLYKGGNHNLSYRFPGKLEQKIRIFSHNPTFRPPIKDNIDTLEKTASGKNFQIYLVSGRFSFLKNRTDLWDRKYGIYKYFKKIFFNLKDEQPHAFKNRIINEERIEKFVDDDLDLLIYLHGLNPNVDFFWLTRRKISTEKLPSGIRQISDLEELYESYL